MRSMSVAVAVRVRVLRAGKLLRRALRVFAAWEFAVGLLLSVLCVRLAWDYLAPDDLDAPDSATVANELIVELADIASLTDAHINLDYSNDAEVVWIGLGAAGPEEGHKPHATIRYRSNGFMTAEQWTCEPYEDGEEVWGVSGENVTRVLPGDDGARVDLTAQGDGTLTGVVCSRDTAVIRRTGLGKVYMAPSLVRVFSTASTGDELLPVTLKRTVHVPTSWIYDQDESVLSWSADKEFTHNGDVAVSGYDEAVNTPRVLVPPEDGAVMAFTDEDAEARAERNAWISALVGGVALALLTSGVSGLIRRSIQPPAED